MKKIQLLSSGLTGGYDQNLARNLASTILEELSSRNTYNWRVDITDFETEDGKPSRSMDLSAVWGDDSYLETIGSQDNSTQDAESATEAKDESKVDAKSDTDEDTPRKIENSFTLSFYKTNACDSRFIIINHFVHITLQIDATSKTLIDAKQDIVWAIFRNIKAYGFIKGDTDVIVEDHPLKRRSNIDQKLIEAF